MIRTLTAALLLVIAGSAAADDSAPPRYVIERIEVKNAHHVSPDVIIAESRLHAGETYTEADLRDAAARLTRLPFLLSADFALQKGTERGQHLLVITVSETKPFFFSLDIRPLIDDPGLRADYSDRIGQGPNHGTAGGRVFVGRRGAFHAAVSSSDVNRDFFDNYSTFDVGYTQYDLFGTSAFATLSLRRTVGQRGTDDISPELVAGVPLTANQTLTFQGASTTLASIAYSRVFANNFLTTETIKSEEKQRIVSITWSYNTTNHPFLPTRGTVVSVTPRIAWSDLDQNSTFSTGAPTKLASLDNRSRALALDAARYFELSDRNSISGKAFLSRSTTKWDSTEFGRVDGHATRAAFEVGFSRSLFAPARENGDSRVEVSFRAGTIDEDVDDAKRFPQNLRDDNIRQLGTSWVRRTPWGTLRLGFGYAW
jgi:outer membrane protein assembly factor BamA